MRKSCRESGDADEDLLNGQNLRCLSACPHLRIARRGFLRVAQLWNGAAANPGHTLHHDGMGSRMRRFSLLFYRTVLPVVHCRTFWLGLIQQSLSEERSGDEIVCGVME